MLWGMALVAVGVVAATIPFQDPGSAAGASVRRPAPARSVRELIEIEPIPRIKNIQGTAFSIAGGSQWMTARHVVERCQSGQLTGEPRSTDISEVLISETDDVAILRTEATGARHFTISARAPASGDTAYLFGFAQGEPIIVSMRLLGVASARQGCAPFPVQSELHWVEVGDKGDSRELSGMSGGPALNANGEVVGVFSASGLRRGRVVTANPLRLSRFEKIVPQTGISFSRAIAGPADAITYLWQMIRVRSLRELLCEA